MKKYKSQKTKKQEQPKIKTTLIVTNYINEAGNMKQKKKWLHEKIETNN